MTTVAVASQPQRAQADPQAAAQSDSNQSPADRTTANHVYAALKADPNGYYRHVTVGANKGAVTLSGFVWSAEALSKAKQIASGVQASPKSAIQCSCDPRVARAMRSSQRRTVATMSPRRGARTRVPMPCRESGNDGDPLDNCNRSDRISLAQANA